MDAETGATRRVEGGRLVFYARRADFGFWEAQWERLASDAYYDDARRGRLGWLSPWVRDYLPREGRILEAGCGLGQHVVALRHLGYDAEGLDYAAETIGIAKRLVPELPVHAGDATCIDVPDGTYAGYISIGVVEHVPAGPEAFLAEALRVLRPGGIAIITVPQFNALRRLRGRLGAYREPVAGLEFYQYAFRPSEFLAILRNAGFEILARSGYDTWKAVSDEWPWIRRALDRRVGRYHLGSLAQRLLAAVPAVERGFGHMMLVVCRRPR